MSKKIEIEWAYSPFEHAMFTIFSSEKKMKKAGYKPTKSSAPALTHFYDDNKIIVLIKEDMKTNDSEFISLLVHECVHVWQAIEKRMGEKDTSMEFEAYSIQSIFLALLGIYQGGKQ